MEQGEQRATGCGTARGPDADAPAKQRVAVVTGLSGAGRSTALGALEDLGWETVDNLPIALIPRLADPASGAGAEIGRPVAIGADTRTRGFSVAALEEALAGLRANPRAEPMLIFLDAADGAIIRRYAETRRRHPMAPQEDAALGVARERDALSGLRERADLVIDTTDMSPHALRAQVRAQLSHGTAHGMAVSLQSFSYKRGAPREADMVMDCRFLRNPHWEAALRAEDGRHAGVDAYVAADPLFEPFFSRLADLAALLLPAYKSEGKAYFCIALGCTGGRHRSVMMTERLGRRLADEGWRVNLRHRELERRDGAPRED
ncbi:RNase adapter RapZ [Rubrimonas cliftonensis]|uniref:UPF0042 nucleotide-binding protein n=1 Tax=Rubrimonas cliftonensis TaxID=89524 RepID=A0A1H3VRX0_9RHOB|nr:RNase adapter RapZ [Rubrimonas cliftonensis]SDZ76862.1 UPF0042 nucleotide-binding protein [Rubrimonas cliftonensis]